MTTEPTETEALLKKEASPSPEPAAKSARVGGYVKAGLALAGVLGVCALGAAFQGDLRVAYRMAAGDRTASLAGHAGSTHRYVSHSNRPGGLFNTCEGKCPAVSVDFDAVGNEPGHAADRKAHLYVIGDTTDRLWHDGFCNDMLTSTERCPYRCAVPEPAALPGNVVPYMCDDPSADTCAAEIAAVDRCCESKWMPNGAKAYQCCVTTAQATTATACRPRRYATGGGTAGFLHVLGAAPEGVLGDSYFSARDSADPPPLGSFQSYASPDATRDRIARGLRAFVRWNLRDGAQPRPIVTSIQSNAQETWREAAGRARLVAREVGETRDDNDVDVFASKSEEDAFVASYADGLRAAIRQVRNILDEENVGEEKEWESGPLEELPMAGDNARLAAVGYQPGSSREAVTAVTATQQQQPATQQQQQPPHVDKVPAPGEPIVLVSPEDPAMSQAERDAAAKKLEEDTKYWAELQRSADAAMDPASRHILRGAVGERAPGDPVSAAAANAAAAAAAYAAANAGAAASLGAIPTELMRSNGNMGSDTDIRAERIVLNPGADADAMQRAFANVEKAEQARLAGHYVGTRGDEDDDAASDASAAGAGASASGAGQSAAAPAPHVAVGNSGSDCVVLRTADAKEAGPTTIGVPSSMRESVERLRRRLNDATVGVGEEMNVPVYRWDESNEGRVIPGLGQYMEDGHHQTFASSMAHVRLFKQFVGEKLPAHCRLA